jgi:hypothetical protein
MATAMTGLVQVWNPTTPRWRPPDPPSLSKEGRHPSLEDLFVHLNRSFSRECALPCVLAFQMHPLA